MTSIRWKVETKDWIDIRSFVFGSPTILVDRIWLESGKRVSFRMKFALDRIPAHLRQGIDRDLQMDLF